MTTSVGGVRSAASGGQLGQIEIEYTTDADVKFFVLTMSQHVGKGHEQKVAAKAEAEAREELGAAAADAALDGGRRVPPLEDLVAKVGVPEYENDPAASPQHIRDPQQLSEWFRAKCAVNEAYFRDDKTVMVLSSPCTASICILYHTKNSYHFTSYHNI